MEEKINEGALDEETAHAEEDAAAGKEKKHKGKDKELLLKIEALEADIKEKDDKYLRLAAE